MADQGGWPQRRDWYLRWGKASNAERFMMIWRGYRGLIVTIGFVAVVVGAWWFWEHVTAFAGWLLDHSEEVRNLMLSAGVVGAGIGVWVAFRRSQTDRLRQVTESFEGAVTLLGHEDRSVRLGAIYALERIARQNRDEHWPIMETLMAYVREWSERKWLEVAETDDDEIKRGLPRSALTAAPADIHAVLTVLGRRRLGHERDKKAVWRRLDLADAYLVEADPDPSPQREFGRANLRRASLSSSDLAEANLKEAHLFRANLEGAFLNKANLEDAILFCANLQGAYLDGANARGCSFGKADLRGARLDCTDFKGANLVEADLRGADLSTTRGLTQEQLNSAIGDADTKIPGGLTRPAHWSG